MVIDHARSRGRWWRIWTSAEHKPPESGDPSTIVADSDHQAEVSRKLTQLDLAGVLHRVRGLVFGQCTRCASPQANASLTLDRVLREQVGPLTIPSWRGALIGHIERQFTLPIGVPVEIDAAEGTIQLLESAVC